MKFSDKENLEGILMREENLNKQEELDDLKEWSNGNGITCNSIKWHALYLRIYKTDLCNKLGVHQLKSWEWANHPWDLLQM